MELRPTDFGDGAAGLPPQPAADVAALLTAMLAEQRRQSALLERHAELLHRIVLGDLAQLDAADVKAALQCGDRKLNQLVEDGHVPMYQLADGGTRRIGASTLRAILRAWADRRG